MASTSKAPSPMALLAGMAMIVACFVLNVQGCKVTIRNSCSYAVTTCARSGASATARYQLGAGATQDLDFGSACKWPSAVVFASVDGSCNDANRANLAEFNIGETSLDYYDLSNVDAYTIGMQIIPARGDCKAIKCSINDIRGFCQPNNRLDSFANGALSCHNTDGQAGIATPGNQQFKRACPDAYSYNYDDAKSTFTCPTGTDYQVVFCPAVGTHEPLQVLAQL